MALTVLERWQKLSLAQQRLAIAGGLVVGVWCLDFVGLSPLRHQIRQLRQQVQEAEGRLSRAVAVNTQATTIRTAYEAGSTVSVALELEATPAQLINLLDNLQRSTQLLKVTQMTLRLTNEQASTLRCTMVISKLLLAPPPLESP